MRSLILMSALLAASSAAAQQSRPAPPAPAPAAPATTPAPPTILSFPPLMPPVAGGLTGGVPFTPPSAVPPRDIYRVPPGKPFITPGPSCAGFNCATYLAGVPQLEPSQPGAAAETGSGMLRLDGTPADAQVFIDGVYVGVLRDIEAQRVVVLPEGVHHVDFRAADHEPASIDIRIAAHDTVTYRVALEPARPRPTPPRPPQTAPTHMYVIPNCYIGNVPPRATRLPAGCDIKRVQVL